MIEKCGDPVCSKPGVTPPGVWAVFLETVNSNEENICLLIEVTLLCGCLYVACKDLSIPP